MLDYLQLHLALFLVFGYALPAAIVFWYSLGEYLQLQEIDYERLTREAHYDPILSTGDHVMFYVTSFAPVANFFCALIIIGVETCDGFFVWVMNLCHGSEHRRQGQQHADTWTTPL